MKIINDVSHFLNKVGLVADSERDEFKKFNCIRKVSTNEFQGLNTEKLINMLGVVDDIHILFITQYFQIVRALTNVLRDDIFLLFSEKMENE